MIASTRRRHGNEFAKRPKRNEAEKNDGYGVVKKQGNDQDHKNRESGDNPFVEIAHDCRVEMGLGSAFEDLPGDHEQPQRHQNDQFKNNRIAVERIELEKCRQGKPNGVDQLIAYRVGLRRAGWADPKIIRFLRQ